MERVVDILKIAISNEVRSKVYYQKASEMTQDGESQMVFLELVGMEDGHARLLVERFGDVFAAEEFDAKAFAVASERKAGDLLTVEQDAAIREGRVPEVLEHAIQFEIRARDTYLGLVERMVKEEQRDLLKTLAAEEQKHHDMLSRVRTSYDTPPEERAAL